MRYLIAGGGPAGVHCAEAIRKRDPSGQIAMLSPEGGRPYSRITVPEYMSGEVIGETIYFRPDSFFEDNRIDLLPGKLAALKPGERVAVLDNGEKFAYDRLLIATGSRPALPPWADGELPGVHSLWSKADAEGLAAGAKAGDTAIVIGGGLVGLQAARALTDHGLRVTVLEAADRLMPQQLDDTASGMLRQAAETAGVRVETGVRVSEIRQKAGRACGVTLEGGKRIDAPHILVCIGVCPNLEMLRGTGVDWERGVEVDLSMATGLPGVYAAGDVVKAPVYGGGDREVRAIWLNAVEQGEIAGINMAGGSALYEGSRALNSIQLFGLAVASAGVVTARPGMEEIILSHPVTGTYRKLIVEDGSLAGALIAGNIQDAGPLFAKIGRPLTGFLGKLPLSEDAV